MTIAKRPNPAAAVRRCLLLLLSTNAILGTRAFAPAPPSPLARTSSPLASAPRALRAEAEGGGSEAEALADDGAEDAADSREEESRKEDEEAERSRTDLKRRLYQLAASYDRGFGATPRAREQADSIIDRLAEINPTEEAARGIDGDGSGEEVPLKAVWRMVWTSAFDVVSLGASPFAAPSAIYQDISDPPVATNIIDFIPRAQTFLPSAISPPSLLRAEVTTRASSRRGKPNRVGLIFESVKLQPIEILGRKVDNLPPLSVDLTWPRTLVEGLAGFVPGLDSLGLKVDGEDANADAPGYFDVDYLDEELLIIRQNAPGGVFALVKVDSCDP